MFEKGGMPYRDAIAPFRVAMPQHERDHAWLSLLLDCYALIDYSVSEAIGAAAKTLACHKGCIACCYHVIPLSTLECLGMQFFVHHLLPAETRTALRRALAAPPALCLFNIDGGCTVYPVRPIACRRYIVCSQPCTLGEDPLATRPEDVPEPSREHLYRAIALTLPFYRSQHMAPRPGQHIFDFYARQNVPLASVYTHIIA